MDKIQTQNWLAIIPLAIFQLITGFTLISIKQYPLSALWISGSIMGFIIVIGSWFAFLYFLFFAKQKPFIKKLQWTLLGLCNFSLLCMIFLMANRMG